MKSLTALGLLFLLSIVLQAGWYPAGKYTGVVVFDRWGGCHFITGVHVFEVSELAKEQLRRFNGKTIQIQAKKLQQAMNPGSAAVTELDVIGQVDLSRPPGLRQPPTGSVALRIIPRLAPGMQEFDIEVRNTSNSPIEVDNNQLTTPVFVKTKGEGCLNVSDGPSMTLMESMPVAFLNRAPHKETCGGLSGEIGLANRVAVAENITLAPGQIFEIPLRVSFPTGEYEIIAGFGGMMEDPSIASSPVGFDVDAESKVRLTAASASLNQPRAAPRVGAVCGTVVNENGNLAPGSGVYLLTMPTTSRSPHVSFMATAGTDGTFRIDAVTEGAYYVTANLSDSRGVYIASESRPIPLPPTTGDCSFTLRLHPSQTYTVTGSTSPGPGRTVRMALTSGEAFPLETAAEVRSDGYYEFPHLPPGVYQLSGGANGYGFQVNSDMKLDWPFQWPEPRPGLGPDFNQSMAFSDLKRFHSAEQSYAETYGKGFSATADALGPPPAWYHATAEHSGLLFSMLPPASLAASGYTQSGYVFTYTPAKLDSSGGVRHYSLVARPAQYGVTGKRNFFIDESGVVHVTERDAAATVSDPVLESPF